MTKITLFLATALCIASGLVGFSAQAAKTVVLEEKFLTNPIVENDNWGFSITDPLGTTCTYDEEAGKFMQLRWTTKSTTSTKTLSQVISASEDGFATIELIFKTSGTFHTDGSYLYFMDSNSQPIAGLYFGRNSGINHIARVKTYQKNGEEYIKEDRDSDQSAGQLQVNNPTAKVTFVLNFNTQTYSFSAEAGSFDNETREFTAGTTSVSSSDNPFLNVAMNPEATAATNVGIFMSKAFNTVGGIDLMYLGFSTGAPDGTTGISYSVVDKTVVSNSYYDLVGKKVVGNEKGIIIQKILYSDGSVETKKIINK